MTLLGVVLAVFRPELAVVKEFYLVILILVLSFPELHPLFMYLFPQAQTIPCTALMDSSFKSVISLLHVKGKISGLLVV